MLKRVDVKFSNSRGYHVDLPTYVMMPGTFMPLKKGVMHADGAYPNAEPADVMDLKPTVIVSMPDEHKLNEEGQIDLVNLQTIFEGHPRYDNSDYQPPRVHDHHPVELLPAKDLTLYEKALRLLGRG